MKLLEAVKLSLAITHGKLDEDLTAQINACCADLHRAGVEPRRGDPLVRQAVKLYCRAWYNYQGEGERWQAAYGALKTSLCLTDDYREDRDAAN